MLFFLALKFGSFGEFFKELSIFADDKTLKGKNILSFSF